MLRLLGSGRLTPFVFFCGRLLVCCFVFFQLVCLLFAIRDASCLCYCSLFVCRLCCLCMLVLFVFYVDPCCCLFGDASN